MALATRGRPELLKATVEETLKHVRCDNTELWVLADQDDLTLEESTKVRGCNLNIAPREDTFGGKYNRILTLAPDADVYVAMVDYAPHVTDGFDEKILEAAATFDDGIGFIHNHLANLSFSEIYGITRSLAQLMNGIFPLYFPYWFVDHWIDDIGKMIERVAVANVRIDTSRRPGTMDRREPGFWATFYDAAYPERRRIARNIINSPDFNETEGRKRRLLGKCSHWPLINQRSTMINGSVRGFAAEWNRSVPPEAIDERYRRVRSAAIEQLKGFVAEMEAEQATIAVNQRAA